LESFFLWSPRESCSTISWVKKCGDTAGAVQWNECRTLARNVPDFSHRTPSIGDNRGMSARNGDKARHGRLRKQKIAQRLRNRTLRKVAAEKTATRA
jgi:hypothetical protein